MRALKVAIAGSAALVLGAAVAAVAASSSYRRAMAGAKDAWARIASAADHDQGNYSPTMVADLPEIARRYFNHAIAPGTPLKSKVELDMAGTFLLGEKDDYQTYTMGARQILHPPSEFVWIPRLRSGAMRISGSDALVSGEAWTRFWLLGLIPVSNASSSPDLVRSATFRSTMEGVWVPASLLPQNGAVWEQTGPHQARVRVPRVTPEIILNITLAPSGAIREIAGQRWSNANPDNKFRLQPFGGTVDAEDTFEGYTIPVKLRIGNHYGTDDYLPFFQAEISHARYL
jgi:hypothetical protein